MEYIGVGEEIQKFQLQFYIQKCLKIEGGLALNFWHLLDQMHNLGVSFSFLLLFLNIPPGNSSSFVGDAALSWT